MAGPTGTSLQAQNTAIPRATAGLQDKPMITIDSWPTSPNRYMLYATWIENPGQNVVVSQCDATTASIGAIRRIAGARILAGGFYEPPDARINQARTNVSGGLPRLRKPGTRSALLSHQLSLDPSSEGRTAT